MMNHSNHLPGSHERHLLRKMDNPLFKARQVVTDPEAIRVARQQDEQLLAAFNEQLRELLYATTGLAANVDSEVILDIKERLDRLYENASAVAGDQQAAKQAIRKLIDTLMVAIRQGAGDDAHAHRELDQEEAAREAHHQLLESSVVADLLNPEPVIQADELIATLLSSDKEDILLAIQLFDMPQLEILLGQGIQLIEQLSPEHESVRTMAGQKLVLIQGYVEFLLSQQGGAVNR